MRETIVKARLFRTVKKEVVDEWEALSEGKSWWLYIATVYDTDERRSIERKFYWHVWHPTDEPREFLREFGLRWDREELKEGRTPNAGRVRFYRDGKLVGELEWYFMRPYLKHVE